MHTRLYINVIMVEPDPLCMVVCFPLLYLDFQVHGPADALVFWCVSLSDMLLSKVWMIQW